MRRFKYLAAVTTIIGLVAGSAATAAAATAQPARPQVTAVRLVGGATTVTTAPGVVPALVGNGIVPIATFPGSESVWFVKSGPTLRFTFPVTGGQVSLKPLGGQIHHSGGILFVNTRNGKKIQVSRFTIDLTHGDLTGIVNGDPKARVPLFRLGLSHAALAAGKHIVTARGITVTLTATAAQALDTALGTRLFSAGLTLGTASTALRF